MKLLKKYPEFKDVPFDVAFDCFDCITSFQIHPDFIEEILDKHFVRKEKYDELVKFHKTVVDTYRLERKVFCVDKYKVKEAIDKLIPLNVEDATNMILNNQLKKELGLDK